MTLACIEHVNITVENPDQLAELFCDLFDWKVRWSGVALEQGYTVHVGTEQRYLALYRHADVSSTDNGSSYLNAGGLNHIGLTVNDLEAMEQRVKARGFTPNNHRDYGVCRSFYFMVNDTLEIEVVMPTPS